MSGTVPKTRYVCWFSERRIAGLARSLAVLALFAALSLDLASPWLSLALYLSGAEDCSCCDGTVCSRRTRHAEQGVGLQSSPSCRTGCSIVQGTQANRTLLPAAPSHGVVAWTAAASLPVPSNRPDSQFYDATLYQRPPPSHRFPSV